MLSPHSSGLDGANLAERIVLAASVAFLMHFNGWLIVALENHTIVI